MDFSIVIPAKNEELNIANCLESIAAIDYPTDCYEVIVVDNDSTDQTVEVAKSKGANVFIQPDLTISGLRNFGAAQTTGKVLAFLDADCTVTQNWLSEASRYLNADGVACFGSPPTVPEHATWVQKSWFQIRTKNRNVAKVDWLESMNMFIPAKTFAAIGGFDESLVTCEDYELSVRLRAQGDIIADPEMVAIHHGEAADLGHFFRKERWRATSNRARLLNRDFTLAELPSLLVPPAYCLLTMLVVVSLVLFGLFDGGSLNWIVAVLLGLWQIPLFFLAARKIQGSKGVVILAQLTLLLNVYFMARGLAFLLPR